MQRALPALAVALLLGLVPRCGSAQTLGVLAGPADAVQLQPRGPDSESHGGFLVGAWIEVPTPRRWLSVTAEGLFVRRGGRYPLGGGFDGQIDVDYIVAAVLPTLKARLGPAALVAYAGPAVELHMQSSAALELQAPFRDANAQVFAGVVGGGLALERGRATFRLEGRLSEQLSSAFSGGARDVRHRTTEIVFRLGMRPER